MSPISLQRASPSCLAPATETQSAELLDQLHTGIRSAAQIADVVCALGDLQPARHKTQFRQCLLAFKQAVHAYQASLPNEGREVAGAGLMMQTVQDVPFDWKALHAMRSIRRFCRTEGAYLTPKSNNDALSTLSQNDFKTLGLCVAQTLAVSRYQACHGGDVRDILAELNRSKTQQTVLDEIISGDTAQLWNWIEGQSDVLPHGYERSLGAMLKSALFACVMRHPQPDDAQ